MTKLVKPSIDLQAEFEEFYTDFVLHDAKNAEYYSEGSIDFQSYVKRLTDEAVGINLRQGYVPCSHFWFVDSNSSILGVIRIRHNIDNEFLSLEAGHIGYDIAPSYRKQGHGSKMLEFALAIANDLGIVRALITADEDNVASRQVIENNGGEFEKIVTGKVFPEPLARYWVCCNKSTEA
ncbi:GNAT family N-acetyltransferase [Vibrio sp. FNV 38]|nr:GNAT family N-acetyltransferase [Vibrio sp. FNV 38]